MPVTGDIAELPLPDLLEMMRHRSGKLQLLQTQQISEMQLHFTPGYLCGFMVDKHIIRSESQVVDKLVTVTKHPIGRFIFTPTHASSLMGSVRIHVDRLALIIVSQVDEISVNRQQLSPPHRIFRLQRSEAGVDFEEAQLAEFFHGSVNLLKCGISAEKLASIERISTEQVQLYLYKLSILGLIGPAKRDDLWAQLDAVLQSKSTPLRLTEEQHPPRLPRDEKDASRIRRGRLEAEPHIGRRRGYQRSAAGFAFARIGSRGSRAQAKTGGTLKGGAPAKPTHAAANCGPATGTCFFQRARSRNTPAAI